MATEKEKAADSAASGGRRLLERLHDWWEGLEPGDPGSGAGGESEAEAERSLLELDGDSRTEAAPDGPREHARLWTPQRVAAVQQICGEGCTIPGGERFARNEIKVLALNETMSVVEHGPQLGLFARTIARDTGAWVDGFEPDPILASEAALLSQRQGLAKKAAIRHGTILDGDLRGGMRDAVIAVEALHRSKERARQLEAISSMLKPGGQLLIIDFLRKIEAPTSPAIDLWARYEPEAPDVPRAETLQKALRKLGFTVRMTFELSDEYARHITFRLQTLARRLVKQPGEPAARTELLREVRYWGQRLAVLQSGDVGLFRVLAGRPKE